MRSSGRVGLIALGAGLLIGVVGSAVGIASASRVQPAAPAMVKTSEVKPSDQGTSHPIDADNDGDELVDGQPTSDHDD